jgi:Dimerisation domain of Zinc Transporter
MAYDRHHGDGALYCHRRLPGRGRRGLRGATDPGIGRQQFVYVTVTVPAGWTVKRAHHITERLEADMERALPGSVTFVHVEPG